MPPSRALFKELFKSTHNAPDFDAGNWLLGVEAGSFIVFTLQLYFGSKFLCPSELMFVDFYAELEMRDS
jgi:hypothetical protein